MAFRVQQPVTFRVLASACEPGESDVSHSGLRIVLADQEAVRLFGDWLGVRFEQAPGAVASPDSGGWGTRG